MNLDLNAYVEQNEDAKNIYIYIKPNTNSLDGTNMCQSEPGGMCYL